MRRETSDKALPDRVHTILCCSLQSAYYDGCRDSHRDSMVGRCTLFPGSSDPKAVWQLVQPTCKYGS